MNSIDFDRINHLVMDLIVEFEKEAGKLRAEYDNSSMRIREIDENIYNYKENEDVDIQVFSPRKVDNKNEVRLDSLNKEKDEMQSSVKDISRQMKYYNDKINKLKEIKSIINSEHPTDDSEYSSFYGIDRVINIDEKVKDGYNPDEKLPSNILSNSDSLANSNMDVYSHNISNRDDANVDQKFSTKDNSNITSSSKITDNPSLISNLSRISHKAEVGYKIVDNDSFRAKMEFKSIMSGLEDVINSLKS